MTDNNARQPEQQRPHLRVTRDEALQRIKSRIEEGENLLDTPIESREQLDDADRKAKIWISSTEQLLIYLFDTAELACRFSGFGVLYERPHTFQQAVADLKKELRRHLVQLEAICEQVEQGLFLVKAPQPLSTEDEDFSSIKILFLAANPADTDRLRLDAEMRAIDLALQQALFRDRFDLRQHWAVQVTDLQHCLLRHQPDIVHFSGHGSVSSEIILEDDSGNSRPVSVHALSTLFSILKDNIKCVVLNACYSEQQAQAIAQSIDCVIGMSKAIGDDAAIGFATAFYRALGFGRDVKTAFELGCVQIDLEGLDEQDTPKLLALKIPPENIFFINQAQ